MFLDRVQTIYHIKRGSARNRHNANESNKHAQLFTWIFGGYLCVMQPLCYYIPAQELESEDFLYWNSNRLTNHDKWMIMDGESRVVRDKWSS